MKIVKCGTHRSLRRLIQSISAENEFAMSHEGAFWQSICKSRRLWSILAYRLALAREQANMTQKELSEKTGIYQADISKIERAIGNPSISTLQRLADGVGLELQIDFLVKNK